MSGKLDMLLSQSGLFVPFKIALAAFEVNNQNSRATIGLDANRQLPLFRAPMSYEPVPDDIRELIQRHIDSVAQLEALLFLRNHQDQSWTPSSVAKRLYAPEADIVRALVQLSTDGFLARQGEAYRYQGSEEQGSKVDRLAEVYARHLIPITNLIHAKPRNIREFSDAFKFRRDD